MCPDKQTKDLKGTRFALLYFIFCHSLFFMRAIGIIGPLFSPCEAARSVINYESGGKTEAAGRLAFSEGILMLQKLLNTFLNRNIPAAFCKRCR